MSFWMVAAKQSIDRTRDRIAQIKTAARLQCIKVEVVVDADVVRSLILLFLLDVHPCQP